VPRIENVLDFAARSRMLLLRHDASGVEVDVSLGTLPFERETIDRSTVVKVGRMRLRVSSAEDLVIMKAVARRPKDVADIDSILDVQRNLDLDRIRNHLREFSSVLEMPEIQQDFERLLRRKRRQE
jgi:predicted nucleotidyltransferase